MPGLAELLDLEPLNIPQESYYAPVLQGLGNNLSNAQTFLNNAVTTLQSQVSLAGQIITALASGMETLINNI